MIIQDILHNEELRRKEFPVCREKVFMAHAGVSSIPQRVSTAVQNYAQQCTLGDTETLQPYFQIAKSRELAAKLIDAHPDEIAFVGPTSLALSYVASGLSFRKNDNILIYFDDYPSNVYPWMALAAKGVQVRLINTRSLGEIRAIDVMGQVDEQTRLVALASCNFLTGYRLDVDKIGKFLRDRGILFCLDAIQTVGAFPTSAKYVDFMAADSHKWMLGPCAAGIFYVRKEVQDQLKPPIYGWNNVLSQNYVAQEKIQLCTTARRYEVGTDNLLGLVGLNAAMELLLEVGVDNIARELLVKQQFLISRLQQKGYKVLHPNSPLENRSSIVGFTSDSKDLLLLHAQLEQKKIITSLRHDRKGNKILRVSPHFYNTEEELQRFIDAV
ncbi:MAG: Aminotransferase class [Verrucomicrobiales bacterium]|nr:Aminotransferase class [Verrucomicrobiales bacterium]